MVGDLNKTVDSTHTHLDRRQHHRRVDVLQARENPLYDPLGVPRVAGLEPSERVEDEDLAPLGAVVEGGEQLGQESGDGGVRRAVK